MHDQLRKVAETYRIWPDAQQMFWECTANILRSLCECVMEFIRNQNFELFKNPGSGKRAQCLWLRTCEDVARMISAYFTNMTNVLRIPPNFIRISFAILPKPHWDIALRPCYLPCEFEHIFMTVVHAPVFDQASAVRAGKTIAATVHVLQLLSVDAPCFIVGNFNHCDLSKTLPSFKQYVTLYSQWRMGQFVVMTG